MSETIYLRTPCCKQGEGVIAKVGGQYVVRCKICVKYNYVASKDEAGAWSQRIP